MITHSLVCMCTRGNEEVTHTLLFLIHPCIENFEACNRPKTLHAHNQVLLFHIKKCTLAKMQVHRLIQKTLSSQIFTLGTNLRIVDIILDDKYHNKQI